MIRVEHRIRTTIRLAKMHLSEIELPVSGGKVEASEAGRQHSFKTLIIQTLLFVQALQPP